MPSRRSVVPHVLPFRGDQVGAGAIVLTLLVLLLQLRMGWGAGVHLAVAAVAALGVGLLLAGLAPEERPYVASIVASELVLAGLVIGRLADLLTTDPGWGTVVWTSATFGVVSIVLARAHRAATATLTAGLVVVLLPVAVAEWVADPSDGVLRTLLLLSGLGLALGAIATRDRRPTRAAQLANAGGVAMGLIVVGPLLLGLPALLDAGGSFFVIFGPGWGWELPVLAAGGGLVAYGAADGQRGPVIVGALDLLLFCLAASGGESVLGWPLVLALVAGGLLVVGLRPTTPAPGPPGEDDDPAEPLPLPRIGPR